MTKHLSLNDFRSVRIVLEPGDFALGGDEPDAPPSDLIPKKTWFGIMNLPDDVAIRTSNHNGKVIGEAHWLWARWIGAVGETQDALFVPMLDASDELESALFNAMHGYYRTGFSALRNVLELMTIGLCGALSNSPQYTSWRNGSGEFKFGTACDQLSNQASISAFNKRMRTAGQQSLWDAKANPLPGGYSRRLYKELCNYAHSRPGFTDGDLRKSNGPIYVARVFFDWYYAYLRTISLCSIFMSLARPHDRTAFANLFTDDLNIISPDLHKAFKLVI
jgi:hypothetical protein